MNQKSSLFIFFTLCLFSISAYAADICCKDENTAPECKKCQETSCEPNYIFNRDPKVCKCECSEDQSCEGNKTWDSSACECKCTETTCKSGKTFDKEACECKCTETNCGEGKTLDENTCECKCSVSSCTRGMIQNKDTCKCECPEGQVEVSSGYCCPSDQVAEGIGGIKTCCQGTKPGGQSTPQCCTKMGGKWLYGDTGDARCCPEGESAHGKKGCCKDCCDGAFGVEGGISTNRVNPNCCEALGGTAYDTTFLFAGGICCKGSKDIANGGATNATCCEKAGGAMNSQQQCCKC